jgi:hypothetical protein
MALTKTELNPESMRSDHGTVCLISQAGVADKLLELSRKKIIREKVFINQPRDDWEI